VIFLIHYARVVHAVRRLLSRTGVLARIDRRAGESRWWLWFRSLFSVLDFHDFITLDTPWWTLAAGRKVRDFLLTTPRPRALEWGSGASTVWLGRLCESVVSIESDAHWADMVQTRVGDNVTILTHEIPEAQDDTAVRSKRWGFRALDFTNYVHAADTVAREFDLIVIDGRARQHCLPVALSRLAPGGIILFDNTNRRRYRRALKSHRGLVKIERHIGLTPILPWPTETSIVSLQHPGDYAATDSGATEAVLTRE